MPSKPAPSKPAVHATLTQVDGHTVITVEGTEVGTAPTQAQAINVLCSEAARVGRQIVVTVHTGGNKKHLDISEAGFATWTAGAAPATARPRVAKPTVEPVKLLRIGVAPQPGHTTSTTVLAGTGAPIASASRPVTATTGTVAGGLSTRTRRRRRTVALAAVGVVLGAGLSIGATGGPRTDAVTIRSQTDAWSAAATGLAPDARRLSRALPATLDVRLVEQQLRRAATRHHLTWTGLTLTGPATTDQPVTTGTVAHHEVAVTGTLTGARGDLTRYTTDLTRVAPAISLRSAHLTLDGRRVRAEVAFTVHGLTPDPAN